MKASIAKQNSNSLVEGFYQNGRGLRSTDLKNYTSGDHEHDGFEEIVTAILTSAMNEAGISDDRWKIDGRYFNPEDVEAEVKLFIKSLIEQRKDFIKEKGMEAVGPLMGPVMGKFRGKMDGKKINSLLMERIKEIL